MEMKLKVTHWEKTHKLVTSGFPELENPVFPNWTTRFSYTAQWSKILRTYPHYLLPINC